VLASPAYLKAAGRVFSVEQLVGEHKLLGFDQPDSLNLWPLPGPAGQPLRVAPTLRASIGETLRQLALQGAGIVCLSDFMTHEELRRGDLVQVLSQETLTMRQPIHAVYYRQAALSSRIGCFLDFLGKYIALAPWSALDAAN